MLASESVMSALMTSRSFVECLLADAPLDTPGAADSRKSFARELQSALFTVHAVANRFKVVFVRLQLLACCMIA